MIAASKLFTNSTSKLQNTSLSQLNYKSNITNSNSSDANIANLVIDLGHKLGLEVIAEGVETQEQITLLKEYACDQIQGFVLSKPLEINKFEELVEKSYSI